MQLDSLHSDPHPPSTIQPDPSPAPAVLTTAAASSDSANLSRDLSSTFQSSLQPLLDSILLNSNGCCNSINKIRNSNKTNNSDSNSVIINNTNNNNNNNNTNTNKTNNTNAIIITRTETVTGHRIIINDENKSKTTTSKNDINYKSSNSCKRSQESTQHSIQNATQPLDLIEQDSCYRNKHQNQYPRKYFSTTTVCSSSSSSPASSSSLSTRTTESSTSSSPPPPSTDRGANQQNEVTTKDQLGSETQLQGRNKDREILKSPILAHHSHIIYPTIAATTTATTAAATMIEFAAAATTVATKVPKDQDLDHGSQGFVPQQHQQQHQQQQNDNHPVESQGHNTQLCNSSNGFSFAACSFIFSAQSDLSLSCGMSPSAPTVPSQASLNTANSRGEDERLQIPQEQWDEALDPCGNEAQTDGGYISDDLVDSLAIGKERKRSTRAECDDDTFKKRRKNRIQENPRTASFTLTTTTKTKATTADHLLRFLEIRLEQTAYQAPRGKRGPALKQETTLDFDPSAVARSWTTPRRRSAHPKLGKPHYPPHYHGNQSNTYFCMQHQAADQHCHCRKRSFADAIELSRPLSANRDAVDHYPTWIESVKKRKIHQNPTKWTSTLSPAPYIKLFTVRDLWDVMETRMDLSWLADEELWEDCSDSVVENPLEVSCDPSMMELAPSLVDITPDHPREQVNAKDQSKKRRRSECKKIIRQCPCPSQFLRGLWEEELKEQRLRQMIPDTVRRPPRSKVFNPRPIATGPKNIKPSLPSLLTPSSSSESSSISSVSTTPTGSDNTNDTSAEEQSPQSSISDLELSLKKKHRAAAIIRSHAVTEGSDMSEYRPWKDGTVIPHQGSLCSLKELRCNIMDPWPAEEAKSKDECTRILHRMREQLNVVINLQIHLRSMIKTAPTQWSFLLSIRHPGQVSIELLLALYGPHFMQTSNFRAIEQLLWGTKASQHQPQPETDGASALLHT